MKKLVHMQFGSKVYGTNIPTSDDDFKYISQPDAREIVLERIKKQTQLKNEVEDTEGFALSAFLKHLIQGQIFALDMLFTPKEFHVCPSDSVWQEIQNNKFKLLSKNVSAFIGYCKAQANKYCIKATRLKELTFLCETLKTLPLHKRLNECPNLADYLNQGMVECAGRQCPITSTVKYALDLYSHALSIYGKRSHNAMLNQEIDWKALYHAVRVANEALELLTTGHVTLPRPEAKLLLDIRLGNLKYETVAEIIETRVVEVDEAKLKSSFPDKPDYEFIDDLLERQNLKTIWEAYFY